MGRHSYHDLPHSPLPLLARHMSVMRQVAELVVNRWGVSVWQVLAAWLYVKAAGRTRSLGSDKDMC